LPDGELKGEFAAINVIHAGYYPACKWRQNGQRKIQGETIVKTPGRAAVSTRWRWYFWVADGTLLLALVAYFGIGYYIYDLLTTVHPRWENKTWICRVWGIAGGIFS